MLPILQVGPLALQLPGLLLLLSLWLGLSLSEKHSPKHGVRSDSLYNLVFTGLVAGILGARLAYAGRFPEAFMRSPGSLISLNPGLLDPAGGILIGLAAAFLYGNRKGLAFWTVLDAMTPLLVVMVIGSALANLESGKGFGAPTDLPWGLEIWGAHRHPSQVYEIASGLIVLALLWPARHANHSHPPGEYFLRFIVLTAFAKVLLEGFRGDSVTLENGFRLVQLAAWLVAAGGLAVLWRRGRVTGA